MYMNNTRKCRVFTGGLDHPGPRDSLSSTREHQRRPIDRMVSSTKSPVCFPSYLAKPLGIVLTA